MSAILRSRRDVGYNSLDMQATVQKIYTVGFEKVQGGAVDINAIIPHDGGEIADGGVTIWWWNPNKNEAGNIIGNEYAVWSEYWYDPLDPNADEDGLCYAEDLTEYRWVLDDTKIDPLTGELFQPAPWVKSFIPGDGFFCKPNVDNPELTMSGAVLNPGDAEAYYNIKVGSTQQIVLANPFPTALDLQTLIPFDGEEIADGNVSVWWWNPNKNEAGNIIGNEYAVWSEYWYDPLDPNADEDGLCYAEDLTEYRWVLDDTKIDPLTGEEFLPSIWTKTIPAGEGFFCKPNVDDPTIKFPNPFFAK